MTKVAITGSTGLVGSRIVELLRNRIEFIPLVHETLDITNERDVFEVITNTEFEFFLHVAAYTDVERAEIERERAQAINVAGTEHICRAVTSTRRKLIYFSTDFVFDGTHPPYAEDSLPHPLGVYGKTKYAGEEAVRGNAMIIRISSPYRTGCPRKQDFVRRVRSLLERRKELRMVTDSCMTPTLIDDIAYATAYLMNHFSPETIHIVGTQGVSPYEAGKLIANTFQLDATLIKPTSFAEFSAGRAPRPQYSAMTSKKNTFYAMRSFEEGLRQLV